MLCTVEANGPRALEVLRAAASQGTPFDIALVASQTEDLRGDELVRRIAAEPALTSTKLVLIGHLGEDTQAAELPGAVVPQLQKPMHASHLYDCIVDAFCDRVAAPAHSRSGIQAATGSRPRVLLVEDNDINQLVATEYLAKLGYQADVAHNGLEAIEAVQRLEYAAILMDCQMPVMDGYQATREIRRREAPGKHVPIIALTAHALIGEREKVLAAGMDEYLTKPLSPAALRNALAQATGGRAEHGGSAGLELRAGTSASAAAPAVAAASAAAAAPAVAAAAEADLDGSIERWTDLSELFLELVPGQIEELDKAIGTGQASEVSSHAHKLKGGTLIIGARRMASVAAEIEDSALLGHLSQAPKRMVELRRRFFVVSAQLQEEIASAGSALAASDADDRKRKES
jgi:CheY-like chemotaxis protein/HPt (histidine-containing phosphotransfer) domain-containing protein